MSSRSQDIITPLVNPFERLQVSERFPKEQKTPPRRDIYVLTLTLIDKLTPPADGGPDTIDLDLHACVCTFPEAIAAMRAYTEGITARMGWSIHRDRNGESEDDFPPYE
jgi:hypothetical protein